MQTIQDEQQLQHQLIDYMFRRNSTGKLDAMGCLELWFGKSHKTDNQIRSCYGDLVHHAIAGRLDRWMDTPHGCLALMILVDQFPRNIYRHTVHMYDGDAKAMEIIATGHNWKAKLTPEECLFVPCLILTHQENLQAQHRCVEYYEQIEPDLAPEFRIFRTIFEEHLKIINLCGVFPHRDHYFGRKTSEIGRMILEDPNVRFDLPLICEKNGRVRFGTDPTRLWKATAYAFDAIDQLDYLSIQGKHKGNNAPLTGGCLSDEQIAFCKDSFKKFDKDGNNRLSLAELCSVLRAVARPYSAKGVQEAMDIITGRPNSNSISFEEFATLLQSDLLKERSKQLPERFKFFDVDGSGTISLEELRVCIRNIDHLVTNAEIEAMLKTADSSGDGQISYEEFDSLFQELHS
jgi:uncharacterized protein (DUF924 family)/Ca2+-binding EF-hand superfamily protein